MKKQKKDAKMHIVLKRHTIAVLARPRLIEIAAGVWDTTEQCNNP